MTRRRLTITFVAVCVSFTTIIYLNKFLYREQTDIIITNAMKKYSSLLSQTNYSDFAKSRRSDDFNHREREEQHSSFEDQHQHLIMSKQLSSATTTIAAQSSDREAPLEVEGGHGVEVSFDPYGVDTVVYVHIQKTGGSKFLEHLVTAQIPSERFYSKNRSHQHPGEAATPRSADRCNNKTDLPPQFGFDRPSSAAIPLCQTSRFGGWTRGAGFLGNGSTFHINHEMCPKDWEYPNGETWLVSEKTTAWNCGVHAFYTDFNRCLSNATTFNRRAKRNYGKKGTGILSETGNRFHYVVLLRHPLLRYISEYLHVKRGACWKRDYTCNGEVQKRKLPPFGCPDHYQCNQNKLKKFSANLTLEKFAKCQDSWSTNRMTISLADEDESTCWNKTRYTHEERNQLLLQSAKSNLLNFSYFGINEFFSESGALFEKTFGVVLKNPPQDHSLNKSLAGQFIDSLKLNKEVYKLVVENNRLDLELYEYAMEMFKNRMRTIGRQLDSDALNFIHKLSHDIDNL